jgi:hypothetical protein
MGVPFSIATMRLWRLSISTFVFQSTAKGHRGTAFTTILAHLRCFIIAFSPFLSLSPSLTAEPLIGYSGIIYGSPPSGSASSS